MHTQALLLVSSISIQRLYMSQAQRAPSLRFKRSLIGSHTHECIPIVWPQTWRSMQALNRPYVMISQTEGTLIQRQNEVTHWFMSAHCTYLCCNFYLRVCVRTARIHEPMKLRPSFASEWGRSSVCDVKAGLMTWLILDLGLGHDGRNKLR